MKDGSSITFVGFRGFEKKKNTDRTGKTLTYNGLRQIGSISLW